MCARIRMLNADKHYIVIVYGPLTCVALGHLQAEQPAFFVPAYLQSAGVEVVPVPVFYPDITQILGKQVYRRVQDVPGEQPLQQAAACCAWLLMQHQVLFGWHAASTWHLVRLLVLVHMDFLYHAMSAYWAAVSPHGICWAVSINCP